MKHMNITNKILAFINIGSLFQFKDKTEQSPDGSVAIPAATRYKTDVRNITEDNTGLVILFSEEQHSNRGLRISFGYTAGSYRRIDETLCDELIAHLDLLYGKDFYSQWTFFIVHNSNYAKWLNKCSSEISNYIGYTHFSFLTSDIIIDVLATQPPTFSDVDLP